MNGRVFASGYADVYDLLYADKDYSGEIDLLEGVFRRLTAGSVHTVLDLGCGTGNHAIPLAQRGYRVTGVDRSPEMIARARQKLSSGLLTDAGKCPDFVTGDLRTLDLGQQFDAVLMMFAVLGYQVTNDDVLAALQTVRRHLAPHGIFVCDIWYGPAVLAIRPSDQVKVLPTENGEVIRAARTVLDVAGQFADVTYHSWRIENRQVTGEATETHRMRYFFPQELKLFMSASGLGVQLLAPITDLDRQPDESTWNVLCAARAGPAGKALNGPKIDIPSLTAILPTYNERDNISPLIERILRAVDSPVQVIVVDDDSPDGTWQTAKEIAAREPRVRVLRREHERGLTSALRAGIQAAETEIVSWMDCDLAMPPEAIPPMLERVALGADIVVGSRYVPGGSDPGHSLMARAFSVTINLFAVLLLGRSVRDYTSGFVVARRAVFEEITLCGDYGEYCIDLLARAQMLGLRIEEVPYTCGARASGESKTGANGADYLRRGWKYVVTVVGLARQKARHGSGDGSKRRVSPGHTRRDDNQEDREEH